MKASDALHVLRALHRRKSPGYQLRKKLGGPQKLFGPLEKGKFLAPAWNQTQFLGGLYHSLVTHRLKCSGY
jgi:hypothetical protein